MNQRKTVEIIISTIEHLIPEDVSQCVQNECTIIVNDLSDWDIKPTWKHNERITLLGVFGLENDMPVIGINHKELKTPSDVINTTMHEVAHFALWKEGVKYGEIVTKNLVKKWKSLNQEQRNNL